VAAVDSLNLFLCLSLELELELEHGEETRKVLCGSSLSLPFLYLCLLLRICGIWKRDNELGGGQVDAFTDSAFKGNPAAVCLLEEERDEHWLQAVAAEFNITVTCYLTRLTGSGPLDSSIPKFRLRWFTPVTEVSSFTSTSYQKQKQEEKRHRSF